MQQIVINGNNIDVLKTYPDNYFDSVVTDAPYGLGKEPIAEELMKDWIEKGYHEVSGSGFMGKEWDSFVPQPIFWKEVFRVLKYGGHCLSFYGSRTYDWGVMAMRFAGFEVRDTITWHFGSGFPKSHNVSKAIDKMYGAEREVVGTKECGYQVSISKKRVEEGYRPNLTKSTKEVDITAPSTDKAKEWEGWGSALKPASEYIVMARKPLEKGLSIAENVLKWGTGAINIDGCRVGSENRTYKGMSANKPDVGTFRDDNWMPKDIEVNVNGRFPANLILTHHPECECVGTKKVKSGIAIRQNGASGFSGGLYKGAELGKNEDFGYTDENGEETIEEWECVDGCPIKLLDEQSGSVGGDSRTSKSTYDKGIWGNAKAIESKALYNDKGGASRFFYVAKASKSERNKGLEGFEEKIIEGRDEGQDSRSVAYKPRPVAMANTHPTVKPIKLMQYLVRLVTPPNGIVLDPFVGSGTTGIACKLEGFNFVGLEQDAEYCKIAQARIENYVEEIQKPTKRKVETDECVTDEIINTTQLGLF
jgi:site-specific DNA-methyltransferase (adenine-specific)